MKNLISILTTTTIILLFALFTLTPARSAFGTTAAKAQFTPHPSHYADFRNLPVAPSRLQEAGNALHHLN